MNDVQRELEILQGKGWTLAALADELEVTVNTVEKWKASDTYPRNAKGVLVVLGQLARRKRIPKQRRYATGSRRSKGQETPGVEKPKPEDPDAELIRRTAV